AAGMTKGVCERLLHESVDTKLKGLGGFVRQVLQYARDAGAGQPLVRADRQLDYLPERDRIELGERQAFRYVADLPERMTERVADERQLAALLLAANLLDQCRERMEAQERIAQELRRSIVEISANPAQKMLVGIRHRRIGALQPK